MCAPLQKLKAEKKQFKEVVCRMFMDQLKPHYQSGKFRTPVSVSMGARECQLAWTLLLFVLAVVIYQGYSSGLYIPPLQDDYTHLLRILSLNYFKTYKSRGELPSNDEMNTEVVAIVAGLMPRIEVYSKDMDNALGLAGSGTDSKSIIS